MQNKLWKKASVSGVIILFIGLAITPMVMGNPILLIKFYLNEVNDKKFLQNIPPIANYTYEPDEIMTGDLVYFNSTSYDPDGIIINWTWDFGDGTQTYDENVTHIYLDNGNYEVNLTVMDNDSYSAFIVKNIFVGNQAPIANFTYEPDEIMTGDLIYFNSTSYDPDGIIINWTWDFGDGTQAYEENVTHIYLDNGNYEVNLTVMDNDNAEASIIKNILVSNHPPIVNYTYEPNEIMTNDLVYFNSTSYDPDGIIVNWTWDLGDGTTQYGEYVTHMYSNNGNYDVNLSVLDNDSATAFIVKNIFVGTQLPVANFTYEPDEIMTGDLIYFNSTSYDPDGIIINWTWDFADGTKDYEENVTHTYSNNGNYEVNLTVKDNDNATAFTVKNIYVGNQPPTADFTYEPNKIKAGDLIFFNSTSYDPDGLILNWTWDFGDGTQAYEENVTHTYSNNGNYEVNLTVKDNDNATAFTVKNIYVGNQPPTADFTYTPEYPFSNEIIYFTDNSTDPDSFIIAWLWDFGDGYYSDLQNTTHIFYKYGNFTVNLSVTDEEGSINTVEKIVTVIPTNDPPYAPIITGPDIVNSGKDYTFMYQSIDPDEDNIRFIVTWGDSTEDISEFTTSNTPVILNHTWTLMVPVMVLRMTALAEDEKGVQSTLTEKWIIVIKSKNINNKNSVPTQKMNLKNYVKTFVSLLKNRLFRVLFLMILNNHFNFFPILQKIIHRSGLQ